VSWRNASSDKADILFPRTYRILRRRHIPPYRAQLYRTDGRPIGNGYGWGKLLWRAVRERDAFEVEVQQVRDALRFGKRMFAHCRYEGEAWSRLLTMGTNAPTPRNGSLPSVCMIQRGTSPITLTSSHHRSRGRIAEQAYAIWKGSRLDHLQYVHRLRNWLHHSSCLSFDFRQTYSNSMN
jgi:hypothetical protein